MAVKFKKYEVKTFIVKAYCDECDGELEPTGRVFTTNPLIYEYRCKKCGKIHETSETFGGIEYEYVKRGRKK